VRCIAVTTPETSAVAASRAVTPARRALHSMTDLLLKPSGRTLRTQLERPGRPLNLAMRAVAAAREAVGAQLGRADPTSLRRNSVECRNSDTLGLL
jgi:hypothetical protein